MISKIIALRPIDESLECNSSFVAQRWRLNQTCGTRNQDNITQAVITSFEQAA
jgi:hypothetical protein